MLSEVLSLSEFCQAILKYILKVMQYSLIL